MVSKDDLIPLGFSEKSENVFIKSYMQNQMTINGIPQGVPFIFEMTLDNSDEELGTNIEFRIDGTLGMTGYYKDFKDLQSSMKKKL